MGKMSKEKIKYARKLLESGKRRSEIAKMVGVSTQTIYSYFPYGASCRQVTKKIGPEEEKMIAKLRHSGLTYTEIAEVMGISRSCIYKTCERLGLKGRRVTISQSEQERLNRQLDNMEKEHLAELRKEPEVKIEDGIYIGNFWKRTG